MNAAPLVSIITPCYNARPYLPATWRSIKRQTFSDWEWIIWEDGSKDGSAEWLQALANTDSRIKVLRGERTKNAGAGRNKCMAVAAGKYWAFLDADDLWHPLKLEKQVSLLESNPHVHITYSWMKEFWSIEALEKNPPPKIWPRHELRYNALSALLTKGNPASPSTLFIRKNVAETIGGFKTDLAGLEDFEFVSRAVNLFKIKRTKGVLAAYRLHQQNMTHSMSNNFTGHERLLNYLHQHKLLNKNGGNAFRSIYHTRRMEFILEEKIAGNAKLEIIKALYWNGFTFKRWIPLLLIAVPKHQMLNIYVKLKRIQARILPTQTKSHRFTSVQTSKAK